MTESDKRCEGLSSHQLELYDKLTRLQKAFALNILDKENMSQREAYIRAGGTAKTETTIDSGACELLTNPKVDAFIRSVREAAVEKVGIDAAYVLKRLAAIEEMDMSDIYDEKGVLKPIHSWPKIWRQMVKEVNMKTGVVKFYDKTRVLELMGKHVGVRAFAELVEVDVKEGFGGRLAAARAKARARNNG